MRSRLGRRAVSLFGLLAGCGTLPPGAGPLPVRNQHPAQLLAAHPDPVPAQVLPGGVALLRFDNAYTSLWLISDNGPTRNSLFLDGETWRTALDLRVGLGQGLELEAELPFGYASGGFLDSFVIGWHDLFGFPDQGRRDNERDAFAVEADRLGEAALSVEPHRFQIADTPLGLRARLLGDDTAALAVRAVVELPTGDEEAGFGNGGVDVAVGLVGDVRVGDLSLFAHGHHTFVHTSAPARRAGLALRDVTAVGAGGILQVAPWLSLLLQTQWETSVLRDLAIARAANEQWLLWAGFRVACSEHTFLELALGEDIGAYVSPDFTLWASFGGQVGGTQGNAERRLP
ncbi:MAG: DUF3187 family protein [Planctomycetota bacterium]